MPRVRLIRGRLHLAHPVGEAEPYRAGWLYVDSPAEYIAKLKVELQQARARLDQVASDRDGYQDQGHVLTERINNMTSAASMAAGTAHVALTRLECAMKVVDAAYFLTDNPNHVNAHFRLHAAVGEHRDGAPS